MNNIETKRYQLALWYQAGRDGPGLKLQFDSLVEATTEFERLKNGRVFRNGVLYGWHKRSGLWELLDQFTTQAGD